ncbi:ABC transporter permease [Streptacidiphilus carbonis]|uniref:ABC transporter permease n=1 Tax=Streptacidiphilus carbonis TaxID=105422 RepID=UPI0005AA73F4|nr:ABC transporter permease [Streptacidiphilus carbonis]
MTATPARGRLAALGRAEATLLLRNRTALATALLLPALMVAAWRPAMRGLAPGGAAATADADELLVSSGIGFILLFVVYYNLVAAYVARRETLVLKRLRTGEPTDLEILAGTALPAAAVAVAQCLALVAAGTALLHLPLPRRPELLLVAVALGVVLMAALAALSTVITRSVELAQLTTTPLLVVSALGSGLLLPLSSMPFPLGEVCRWLPLTPVLDLVRAGWLGGTPSAAELVRELGAVLAWTLLAVFAVHRWFRWEPRR